MLSNDDDSSNQSETDSNQTETDSMSLEKCPHCDKKFDDQYIWNKFNRDKHITAHFGKKSIKKQLNVRNSPKITSLFSCKEK
jgi:hypothetical protein